MKKLLTLCLLCITSSIMGAPELSFVSFGYKGSLRELKKLYTIDPSKISCLQKNDCENYRGYIGDLDNRSKIHAYYFFKGPEKGSYDCSRRVFNQEGRLMAIIKLDKEIYKTLKNLLKK